MSTATREVWVHALAAKAGGGLTYIRSAVPALARALEPLGIRLILLVDGGADLGTLPPWVEVRQESFSAGGPLRRLLYDQVILPARLAGRNAVLFCSGSFAPVLRVVPTVVLLRNTIYFDELMLRRETHLRRLTLHLKAMLILAGARASSAVQYPTNAMRELVETRHPCLRGRGTVNPYGIGPVFLNGPARRQALRSGSRPPVFLCVMNYTLQKNLGLVLEALVVAKRESLSVRVAVTSTLERGPAACFERDRSTIEKHDLISSGYLEPLGPRHGDALLAAYGEADALLFPSITESFGHPLIEAMALNIPIVAADLPYAREACGRHALYIDPSRPEALVDIWRRWPEVAAELEPVDRARLARRFSWQAHVERLIEALLPRVSARDSPGGRWAP